MDDHTPLFYPADDPLTLRFHVKAVVWVSLEKTPPSQADAVWHGLLFTQRHPQGSLAWTGHVRGHLTRVSDADGPVFESWLRGQAAEAGQPSPVDTDAYRKLVAHQVRRTDQDVTVTVPDDTERDTTTADVLPDDARESITMQALLAAIGSRMGMPLWIPRVDRTAVLAEWQTHQSPVLERLPLHDDETTRRTIERIDVLWLSGRSIKRAFAVEHPTSLDSGSLRRADLLTLQPHIDIRLHLVAPAHRREQVTDERQRPLCSLLERGALSESCPVIASDSIRQLALRPDVSYRADTVLDAYDEEA